MVTGSHPSLSACRCFGRIEHRSDLPFVGSAKSEVGLSDGSENVTPTPTSISRLKVGPTVFAVPDEPQLRRRATQFNESRAKRLVVPHLAQSLHGDRSQPFNEVASKNVEFVRHLKWSVGGLDRQDAADRKASEASSVQIRN